jgi:hypothetical protein
MAIVALGIAADASGDNPLLGEIQLQAASKIDLDAGVWLDDQYVGFVKDLRGNGRIVTVPGEHRLLFQLVGYEDVERSFVVEPGEQKLFRLKMREQSEASYPDKADTARVRFEVEPDTAAVFVNGEFVGPVNRFDGRSGMRMSAGTYQFKIALPGYQAFATEMTVISGQTYEVKTKLPKGSIGDQAAELTAGPVRAD